MFKWYKMSINRIPAMVVPLYKLPWASVLAKKDSNRPSSAMAYCNQGCTMPWTHTTMGKVMSSPSAVMDLAQVPQHCCSVHKMPWEIWKRKKYLSTIAYHSKSPWPSYKGASLNPTSTGLPVVNRVSVSELLWPIHTLDCIPNSCIMLCIVCYCVEMGVVLCYIIVCSATKQKIHDGKCTFLLCLKSFSFLSFSLSFPSLGKTNKINLPEKGPNGTPKGTGPTKW